MRWRSTLDLAGADDTREVDVIGAGERSPSSHAAATLGLGLAEGKAILAALQRHLSRRCQTTSGTQPRATPETRPPRSS